MNNILKTTLGLTGHMEHERFSLDIKSVYNDLTFEKFVSYLEKLFNTQDSLNKKMCGEGYAKELQTTKGKAIRFGNALISETSELLDSTPWKHWKAGTFDKDNISVEIIDKLHFLPSIIAIMLEKEKEYTKDMQTDILNVIYNFAWRELNKNTIIKPDDYTIQTEVNKLVSINSIIGGMANLSRSLNIDIRNVDKEDSSSEFYFNNIITKLIGISLGLCFKIHFMVFNSRIENVWSLYVIKNTLNGFRKDNGYEEGTYEKIWNGKEDNIVAMEVMETNPIYSVEDLYDALTYIYNTRGNTNGTSN